MKIAVYDTYVKRKDGKVMHFDILVRSDLPAEEAREFGRVFLKQVGQENQPLTAKECKFCHVEEPTPAAAETIQEQGYYIKKMEGCE